MYSKMHGESSGVDALSRLHLPAGGDENRLARVDVAHAAETEGSERGVLGGDAPLVLLLVGRRLALTEDERADAVRVAKREQTHLVHHVVCE